VASELAEKCAIVPLMSEENKGYEQLKTFIYATQD
jgi:arsenite-transporting ATPase